MSDRYEEFTEQVGQRVTEGMKQVQKAQVKAIRRIRDGAERYGLTERNVTFVDSLPSPRTIVKANFALAEDVLKAYKRYTLSILDAVLPETKPLKPRREKKVKGTSRAAA